MEELGKSFYFDENDDSTQEIFSCKKQESRYNKLNSSNVQKIRHSDILYLQERYLSGI